MKHIVVIAAVVAAVAGAAQARPPVQTPPATPVFCPSPENLHLTDPLNLALEVAWDGGPYTYKIFLDGYYMNKTRNLSYSFLGLGYGVDISDAHLVGIETECAGSVSVRVEKMFQAQWVQLD